MFSKFEFISKVNDVYVSYELFIFEGVKMFFFVDIEMNRVVLKINKIILIKI